MDDKMKKYVELSKEFRGSKQSKESIEKLYLFLEELGEPTDNNTQLILSYVYALLAYHRKAYELFAPLADKTNRKDIAKLYEMEQMAHSHGDTFALKRKPKPIDKSAYQPESKHFVEKEDDSNSYFCNFEYTAPTVIFGKIFSKPISISVERVIKTNDFLENVLAYILFLGDCKRKLIRYYNDNMDDEADNDWYDSLEIFGVIIDVSHKGKLSARITCGDSIWEDHLLDIEIDKEKITDMSYDG